MRFKTKEDKEIEALFGIHDEQPTPAETCDYIGGRLDRLEIQVERVNNNVWGVGMAVIFLSIALYMKWF